MNILFYYKKTFNSRHGGIAHVSYFLGKHLKKRGLQVYFLSAKKTLDNQVDSQHYLPDTSKVISDRNKEYFLNFIQEKKIDVVINQNGISPYCNEALLWCKDLRIPVITVLHNSLFGIYGLSNHWRKLHPFIYGLKLNDVVQKFLWLIFKMKYGKLHRQQVDLSKKVILLSDKFIPETKYFTGTSSTKIMNIPNPITIEVPKEIPATKEKGIVFVGRLVPEKRVDLLLCIWKELYRKYPDWKLTIVGDGQEREAMEKLALTLGLERFSFEGFQSPEKYYDRASIFCMTSAYEGFGLVLVEAMANGTIPLAFNSYANVSDIIDEDINGYLITPFSIEEYADKLSYLMDDEDLRKKMSQQAWIKSKTFSIENITNKWISLFYEIAQ